MIPLLVGAGLGAALGLAKNEIEADKLKKQQRLTAELNRFSPWTGINHALPEDNTNALGAVSAGAFSGLKQGMKLQGSPATGAVTPVGAGVQPYTTDSVDPGSQVVMEPEEDPEKFSDARMKIKSYNDQSTPIADASNVVKKYNSAGGYEKLTPQQRSVWELLMSKARY